MQIFIDESGNLGKKGRYFVIAALIPQNSERIKNIIKRVFTKIIKSKSINNQNDVLDEIKGSALKFQYKQEVLTKLVKERDFSCSYIVADLNYVEPKILKDKNICFNYLMSLLLRPVFRDIDEDIQIIIDNHTTKVGSVHSLKDYIRLEAYTEWGFKKNVNFEYKDSKESKNLQCIDVIANVIYGHYIYGKWHLYDLLNKNKVIIHSIKFPQSKFGE